MNIDDPTLQVEITLIPAKSRHGSQHRRPSGPKVADPPRIPRIARLMALALRFENMLDRGEVRDYADLARLGYVTRARITQIMNMLNLAPDIQEEILGMDGLSNRSTTIVERHLRSLAKLVPWEHQRREWTVGSSK